MIDWNLIEAPKHSFLLGDLLMAGTTQVNWGRRRGWARRQMYSVVLWWLRVKVILQQVVPPIFSVEFQKWPLNTFALTQKYTTLRGGMRKRRQNTKGRGKSLPISQFRSIKPHQRETPATQQVLLLRHLKPEVDYVYLKLSLKSSSSIHGWVDTSTQHFTFLILERKWHLYQSMILSIINSIWYTKTITKHGKGHKMWPIIKRKNKIYMPTYEWYRFRR